MKLKITTKSIAALELPAGKREEVYWDTDLPGFGFRLRRRREGDGIVRTWISQWKRGGRTCKVTLGSMPPVGVEAARKSAEKMLARAKLGEDPQAERRERAAKERNTMRALVGDYLAAKRPRVKLCSFDEITRYLTSPLYFKGLHNMPVEAIRRGDVSKHVAAIERERGSGTAREARRALSAFYSWAMTMGHAESNPVINSFRPADLTPRDRVLSDPELVAIWNACGDDEHGKIVRLLILSGCRRGEIGDMRWSEIDLDRETFTIPPSRSKNKRVLVLPLMPAMRSIIETCPRMASRDQLFGLRSHGYTSWHEGKPALDQRLGDSVKAWRLHDIRRSVATKMADSLGVQPHIIEAVLGHYSGHRAGVHGVYNRATYFNEMRNALALWEDRIRALVEGGERKVLNFQPSQAAST